MDFGTLTLANEVSASRVSTGGTGTLTFPSSSQPQNFSGAYAELDSGTGSSGKTATINFLGSGTNYVGFLWAVAVNNPDTLKVTYTLSNNTTLTVSNCQSSNSGCVAGYVPGSWLTQLISGLIGLVFGSGAPNYGSVYMNYVPPSGLTVTKVDFYAKYYTNCFLIFICSDKSQYVWVDNLSYTDTVQLHHLEVSTPSSSVASGTNLTYSIKACGNASCSTLYTAGVTGSLALSGTGMAATYPAGASFSIPLGSATTTVVASLSPGGTATVGLSGTSPTPATTPQVYCGLGVTATSSTTCNLTVTQALHHIEISSNVNPAVTCSPITYTVRACADSACTTAYTVGLTGTLKVTGTGVTVNPAAGVAFTIPSGSSSVDASFNVTTAGTVAAALSGLSLSPSNTVVCGTNTSQGSNVCNVTVGNSALYLVAPNHFSEAVSSLTVKAVQASTTNSSVCVPAFTTAKAVTLKCSYANPTTGTLPVRVGGVALNSANSTAAACDGVGRSMNLSFDATGTASPNLQYADVGQMTVTATYTGTGSEAGLSMSGSTSFIAVPASVTVSGVPSAVTKAGTDLLPSVTVKNSGGAATPNFGRETTPATVTLAIAKTQPTGTGAVFGTLSLTSAAVTTNFTAGTTQTLSFTNGVSTALTARWSEVGAMTFTATLVGGAYLGVTDALSSVATLTSIPDKFSVTVTPTAGCPAFFFNSQPMELKVTALNLQGATTLNYDGSSLTTPNQAYPASVALSAPSSVGALNPLSLALSAFNKGVATVPTTATTPLIFIFGSKLGAPTTIGLKVTEIGGNAVTNTTIPTIALRSGRLRTFNKFGSEKQVMDVNLQSQYWTGKAWVINALDSCTAIPMSAVSLSGYKSNKGDVSSSWTTTASPHPDYATTVNGASAVQVKNGTASIRLSAPSPTATGSVDLAINLGAAVSGSDLSCLSTHASTTGAGMPWLRSQNGNCVATYDRDPSARLTFGIYTPESTKTIYGRELY
ncbi:MAG TPA: hypothetical protein H9903_21075 [Candidatus Aquabacterium excrementipullorum]|nr:hypothetical protein [Candidatus Aquabacterium excrementipullorum]